jgi:hypothetical protein
MNAPPERKDPDTALSDNGEPMRHITRHCAMAAIALSAQIAFAQATPAPTNPPTAPAAATQPSERVAARDRLLMRIPIGLRGDAIIVSIDTKAGTVTLDGGMVMKIKSPEVVEGITPGLRVEYGVEETKAGLVIIAMRSIS